MKGYRPGPDATVKPHHIVSDFDVETRHVANFGPMPARRVVNEGVLKTAIGYSCGSTMRGILRAHGLSAGREGDEVLTEKGERYARALFDQKGITAVLDFLQS